MVLTKKELDMVYEDLYVLTKKQVDEAKLKNYYSKDLAEAVAVVLSVGYERLKHDK